MKCSKCGLYMFLAFVNPEESVEVWQYPECWTEERRPVNKQTCEAIKEALKNANRQS